MTQYLHWIAADSTQVHPLAHRHCKLHQTPDVRLVLLLQILVMLMTA